ncbi:MAG: hypothetical protein IKO29_04735 [Bacteroidales bacterium]|nr:hypothetical protein [Bacteroidales bacterium]
MKARYILSAALALSLLPGCVKELGSNPGKAMLRAVIEEETKVSFDGVDGRFSWNTGDQIAVYVGSAFQNATVEPTTGDFSVEETETELRNFYAVYPAAIAVADGAPNTLKVNLPASYDVSALAAAGDDEFSPVAMVAENHSDQDLLYFRHVGGLLRIVCTNLPAGVKTVTVSFDNDVTGEYTVNVSNPRNPRITNRGEGETSNAGTVTFTVSANGLPATNSFALNVPVPCGTYAKVVVKAYGNSTTSPALESEYSKAPMTFARHHGKLLFFGETPGERTIGVLKDVTAYYFGGSFTLSDAFVSYKFDEYGDKEAAPFVFEYSATGADGSWTTTKPDWLDPDPSIDFGGFSRGREMRLHLDSQPNLAVDPHAEALKARTPKNDFDLSTINVATGATVARTTANCYVVQAPGTYKFPLVYGNGVKDGAPNESAYRARVGVGGAYRAANGDAAITNDTDATQRVVMGYLGYFKNHLYTVAGTSGWSTSTGNITNPYIEELLPANTTYTAQLIWTDAPDLIKNVNITGSGQNAYITFEVDAENICQGNAMVALLADGKIAWSWHIWVTDEDLTALKDGMNGVKFAPVNIGWVGTRETQRYETKQIYMRARQTETGGAISNTVLVTSQAGPTIVDRGSSPYYQWGRKDPLPGAFLKQIDDQLGAVRKSLYSYSDNYRPKHSTELWRPLGVVIQHPNIRYNYTGPNWHGWNWMDKYFYNLWNTTYDTLGETTFDVPVTKSVYDPSPVGFKVPGESAFASFTDSNLTWSHAGQDAFNDGTNGRTYNNGLGVFLPEAGYVLFDDSIHYNMSMYWSANLTNNSTDNFRRGYAISFTESTVYPKDMDYLYDQLPVRSIQE